MARLAYRSLAVIMIGLSGLTLIAGRQAALAGMATSLQWGLIALVAASLTIAVLLFVASDPRSRS